MAEPAFLALWNDFLGGREAEYDTWHTREHVPERVAAPGFRRGIRYVDRAHPVHRWFTLYDVDDIGTFDTPQYRDLLDNPTPWSASMRPDFRNFLRVPCVEIATAGFGVGGALAVLRIAMPDAAVLQELVAMPGIVRARLGRPAAAIPADAAAFDAVLLLDTLDRGAAQRVFDDALTRFAPGAQGGVYDLAFLFPANPAEPAAHARHGWAAM